MPTCLREIVETGKSWPVVISSLLGVKVRALTGGPERLGSVFVAGTWGCGAACEGSLGLQ